MYSINITVTYEHIYDSMAVKGSNECRINERANMCSNTMMFKQTNEERSTKICEHLVWHCIALVSNNFPETSLIGCSRAVMCASEEHCWFVCYGLCYNGSFALFRHMKFLISHLYAMQQNAMWKILITNNSLKPKKIQ